MAKKSSKSAPVVFAFDIGIGSLGEAVRRGKEFLHVESLLIDPEFAGTAAQATKRRATRSRHAHKARELWWNRQCKELGIPILKTIEELPNHRFRVTKVDPRLKREFPRRGDSTLYTSCLLRIALLEGQKLEPWQIYKAVHSAIQKRGYDAQIAWKGDSAHSTDREQLNKEDSESSHQERLTAFTEALHELSKDKKHQLPCYFDASRMGLWSEKSGILSERQDHKAEPASVGEKNGYTAPRAIVEAELRQLLEQVRKRYPKLKVDQVIHGPAGVPYASFYPEHRKQHGLKRGHAKDWEGLLGQKVPRFDNRILSQCMLIPRLHTCRADDPAQRRFHLLAQLHNLRFIDTRSRGAIRGFTPDELKSVFEAITDDKEAAANGYKVTKTRLKQLLSGYAAEPSPAQNEIPEARTGGRSRFSRPALFLLKRLYLSGLSPLEFKKQALELSWPEQGGPKIGTNSDPIKGLTALDLAFLDRLSDRTWENISIVPKGASTPKDREGRETAIRELIGGVNNPKVRHRLEFIRSRLSLLSENLAKQAGGLAEPDEVVIEFVREDFMGAEQKKRYIQSMNERRKENEEAAKAVGKKKGTSSLRLKYRLAKEQGFIDPYDGKPINPRQLEDYEFEHIVHQSIGGPDAFYNKLVSSSENNNKKGNRTPYQWLSSDSIRWGKYIETLKMMPNLSRKKRALLTSPEAPDLCEKYTALAETAYIARLTQSLVYLHFGWRRPEEGGSKRVQVINGGLTARVRARYRLNDLLGSGDKKDGQKASKDRTDRRHHALDAMVLSFLADWMRDPNKKGFVPLPIWATPEVFERQLAKTPPRTAVPMAPELEENFYALRQGKYVTKTHTLESLGIKQERGKIAFDPKGLEKSIQSIYPPLDADLLTAALKDPKSMSRLSRAFPIHSFVISALQETRKLHTQEKKLEMWLELIRKAKTPSGSRIRRVQIIESKEGDQLLEPDYTGEFKLLPNDPLNPLSRPTVILKPKGTHKAQLVCELRSGEVNVRPIYVHENRSLVIRELLAAGTKILLEVRSGQIIRLRKECDSRLPPGLYVLSSLRSDGVCVLKGIDGRDPGYKPRIGKLLSEAGLGIA